MSIESAIEQKIKEAMARGEFDDLPGAGKPLDLSAYFDTPEELRMAFSLLRSNEFVPQEVEMLKEIAGIKEAIRSSPPDADNSALEKKLNEMVLSLKLANENRHRKR